MHQIEVLERCCRFFQLPEPLTNALLDFGLTGFGEGPIVGDATRGCLVLVFQENYELVLSDIAKKLVGQLPRLVIFVPKGGGESSGIAFRIRAVDDCPSPNRLRAGVLDGGLCLIGGGDMAVDGVLEIAAAFRPLCRIQPQGGEEFPSRIRGVGRRPISGRQPVEGRRCSD